MHVTERLTDTLLLIRNIPEEVTLDDLKEIVNDAEDLVFAKHDTRRKDDKKTRFNVNLITSCLFILSSLLNLLVLWQVFFVIFG